MQELQDKIVAAFGGMVTSGKLDEMIETKLAKCIDDILDETLRSYSKFGRALQEGIGESLQVNVEELGLSGYNTIIAGMIKAKVESAITGTWRVQLESDIDDMLRAAPETIKVSEIAEKIRAENEDNAREEGWESGTFIVKKSEYSETRWVYIDPKPHQEEYQCSLSFYVDSDSSIGAAWSRGKDQRALLMGTLRGVELLLFQCRAGGTKVVMDMDDGEQDLCYDWYD